MDEDAFIVAIVATPRDDLPRLVYADWLDEQGDVRGEWVRSMVRLRQLLGHAAPDPIAAKLQRVREVSALQRRLRALPPTIPEAWAMRVDPGSIEHCGMRARGSGCPGDWLRLRESDEPARRSCGECGRWVRYCWSASEVSAAVVAGLPVVKSPVLSRD